MICLVYLTVIYVKFSKIKKINNKIEEKGKELQNKLNIIIDSRNRQEEEIEKLEKIYKEEISKIKVKTNINNLVNDINEKQIKINEQTIKLHTLEIDKNNIMPKLEKLVNIEEELENLKEEKVELEEKRNNIKRAIEYLEIAYSKMKEQITPRFTEELSNVMERISGGKYKKVAINTSENIVVEGTNGEYINAENLSIGTIDQLYLALRLATVKEITKENMPILLDETFAYYDEERLKNILKYFAYEYKEKQIILFTCTDREKQILDNMDLKYNYIEL